MTVGARTILNVNDDEAGRYASTRILQRAGYRVVEAATGREALDRLSCELPDLVVLDVKLPDMSGLEVCRQIKENPQTASTLVLHMSASFVNSWDTVRGLESGADGYLTEPLDPAVLVATVDSLMRLRRAETALRESETRYRLLFERNPLPTWVYDVETRAVLAVNDAALEHYGYSREEFMALTVMDLRPPEEAAALEEILASAPGSTSRDTRHRRKDGAIIEVEVRAEPLLFGNRRARLVIAADVTIRRRVDQARAELLIREQAARGQAEAANRSKDEFLAVLSHELRTPLHAIYGWARMLRAGSLDPGTIDRALAAVERNSALQAQIVEDLLDVSRVITGKLVLELGPVDLTDVAHVAAEAIRTQATARGVRVELQAESVGTIVTGDPARLQQVLGNLLSNAVKFTPGGGRVTVRVCRTETEARLVVRDTGRGISPEFLPHVFKRFSQADSSTTRTYTGLGLGLAIVRHLVELHGGTVSVESEGEGRGATFSVTLPLRAPGQDGRAVKPPPPPAPPGHRAGIHVVVVDAGADSLALAAAVLTWSGAHVSTARSAMEALELMEHTVPDVLVSDIGMPDEDGFTFIRRLRARPLEQGGRVPAVALTAYAMGSDV